MKKKDFTSTVDAYRWTGQKVAGKEDHESFPGSSPSHLHSSRASILPAPEPSHSGTIAYTQGNDAAPSPSSSPFSMTSPPSSVILSYEDVDDHVNIDIHDDHGVAQSRCQSAPSSLLHERCSPNLPTIVARTSTPTPTRQLVFSGIVSDQSRDRKQIKKGRKQNVVKHKGHEESNDGLMEAQKYSIAGSVSGLQTCGLLADAVTLKSNAFQKNYGNFADGQPRKRKSKYCSKECRDNVIVDEQPISSRIRRVKSQEKSSGKINDHIESQGMHNSSSNSRLGHGDIDSIESSSGCKNYMKVMEPKSKKKVKTSAYFKETVKPLGQRNIVNKSWVPPISVYALIQEDLYQDPWKVLVACMLLNKTSGTQMRRVIWDLFALCPTPEAAVAMETGRIEEVIRPLGLQKKRALTIQKFSEEYLRNDWSNVRELHGIGKYATDAYAIFCEGRWREVKPEDHKLVDYWKYLHDTDGLGNAFKDDRQTTRFIHGESDDVTSGT